MHVQPEAETVKIGNRPLWAPGAPETVGAFIASRGGEVKALEFGSGASTIFLLRCGATVVTVEHHEAWAAGLQEAATTRELAERLTVLRRDRPYHDVAHEFSGEREFDLLFVDGRERMECLHEALGLVKRDGLILLDDSQRSRYWPAFATMARWPAVTFESTARSTTIWSPGGSNDDNRFVVKSFRSDKSTLDPRPERVFVPSDYTRDGSVQPGYIRKEPIIGLGPTENALQRLKLVDKHANYLSPHLYALDRASIRIDAGQKLLGYRGSVYQSRSGRYLKTDAIPVFEGAISLPGLTLDLTASGAGLYSFFMLDSLPKLEVLKASGHAIEDFDTIVVNSGAKWAIDMLATVHKGRLPRIVAFSERSPSFHLERSIHIEGIRTGRFAPRWVHAFMDEHFQRTDIPSSVRTESFGRFVYISRQKAQGRRIVNHDDFLGLIAPLGFVEVFAEDHTPKDLAERLRDAEVVISPHGAGLANIIFCPKTTTIIELFSSHYTPQYLYLARDRGQGYHAFPCVDAHGLNVFDRYTAASGSKAEFNREDIVVPVEELRAMLTPLCMPAIEPDAPARAQETDDPRHRAPFAGSLRSWFRDRRRG